MTMLSFITNCKIVILKDSSRIWSRTENEEFKNLFYKMAQLKLRGYEAEYPDGVLPIDTTDFIATHILICEKKPHSLLPLTGIKSTTLSQCEKHQLNFPALSLVQAAEAKVHIQAMRAVIDQCRKSAKELAYTGSWTMDPDIRKDKPLAKSLAQIFYAAYVLHHSENKIDEIITGGTMRFKADQFFASMGHDIFCLNNQPLPPIFVKHLFGEKVQLLHLKDFTDEAMKVAEKYREMWENRIEISAQSVIKKNRAKSAA